MTSSITEVNITPVKPQNGLVAFASFVYRDALYCTSIGIFTRPKGGYRLLYPTKEVAGRQLDIYHPISNSVGSQIEKEIITKYEEVMNHAWDRYDNNHTSSP